MTTRITAGATLMALVVLTLAVSGPTASAQETTPATISGRIVHGVGSADFDPTRVPVTLNILEGVTAFDQETVTPEADGTFEFAVANSASRSYFIGVEYQGARYSSTLGASDVERPVEIEVFEATHDTAVLQFESYTVIVTGATAEEGWIEILERAIVFNESGMTLVPDQDAEGPGMLSFLRFALPPNAYNLDIRSNLVGGDILTVDRGFALTRPIIPTSGEPHLFEFVYRLDYEEPQLDLSRTMRFGAETFRYVVPVETGRPSAPRLVDLGATELENVGLLRLLEGEGIEAGEMVELLVTGLPLPSFASRAGAVAGEWYVRFVAPAVVVALLIVLFTAMMARRRALPVLGPSGDPEALHAALMEHAAQLERERGAGSLSERRYLGRRDDIKRALIDLRLRAGEISEGGEREV